MVHYQSDLVASLGNQALLCQGVFHAPKHIRVFQGPDGAVKKKIFDKLSCILPRDRKIYEQWVRSQSQSLLWYLSIAGNYLSKVDTWI